MTDQDRARALFADWFEDSHDPEHERRAVASMVAEAFAAVRLEERRAIVAYMRERYLAAALADRIERGEHREQPGG